MSKVRIGIDIGAKGAVGIFIDDELVRYSIIPKVADELDMFSLVEIILSYVKDGDSVHAVFEDLRSVYGASAAANFTFGLNNGLVIGALQAMQIPYTKVQAKKWQKQMWEGIRPVAKPVMKKPKGKPAFHEKNKKGELKYKIDTKATSLIAAKRLFPKETFLPTERSKVPHDGIVDAVLMGKYCSLNF